MTIKSEDLEALAVDLATLTTEKEAFLQFFAFNHLPPALRLISAEFARLAVFIVDELPRNPERTVALRKLLEAKDCGVRAALYKN